MRKNAPLQGGDVDQLREPIIVNEDKILLQTCQKLLRISMTAGRSHKARAVRGPHHLDRHIRRPVVAGEYQVDRRLLPGMEAIDDIAVALLGFLERLQARNDAVDRETDGFEYRALPTPFGAWTELTASDLNLRTSGSPSLLIPRKPSIDKLPRKYRVMPCPRPLGWTDH